MNIFCLGDTRNVVVVAGVKVIRSQIENIEFAEMVDTQNFLTTPI